MNNKAQSFSVKNLLLIALATILFFVLLFGIIFMFKRLTSGG